MKSGVTWQVKVRQQARETAREAARRSGMSVSEWLDTVILDSAREDGVEPAPPARREPHDTERYHDVEPRERPRRRQRLEAGADRHDDFEEIEQNSDVQDETRPRRPRYADYDERHRRVPDADLSEIRDRLDELGRQFGDRKRRHADVEIAEVRDRLDALTDQLDERRHRVPNEDLAEVKDRLDRLTALFDEHQRRVPDQELAEVKGRLDHLTAQLDERHQRVPDEDLNEVKDRLDALANQLDESHRRFPEEDFAAVNDRLDVLAQQLDHLVRVNAYAQQSPTNDRRDEIPAEFADALSRLDQRLDQLIVEGRSATTEIERRVSAVDRAVASLDREKPRPRTVDSPSLAGPATPLDQALFEIAERQQALDGEVAPRRADLPRASTQGQSGLEQQLRQITTRIETLKPCGINNAVETLRNDLAEIGVMMKDAMPRKSVEALETEVHALAERLDTKRHAGADGPALAGLERGLAEVRDALRTLTPAESLVGLDEAVRSLTQKIDRVASSTQDPAALEQLEGAIVGLRGVVSHVASDNALATLSEEVRGLAAKVDQVVGSDVLATLEQRIATMADALQSRHHTAQDARDLETVVAGLTDKIERLQLSRADHAAVNHLEDRIVKLVEKLDASDARLSHLETIERGLAELLIHLEHQRIPQAGRGGAPEAAETDGLKRDVQRTQDSLEAVHGTLGHVVDRLAMIETGLRGAEALPKAANFPPQPSVAPPTVTPAPPVMRTTVAAPSAAPAATGNPAPATESERRPIDPNLPPDHPLEPGLGTRGRTGNSPADRIAASEAALGGARPPVIADPGGKSNFIAAARRAALAATSEAAAQDDKRTSGLADKVSAVRKLGSGLSGRVRGLLVGTGVVLLVLGSLQIMMNWLGSSDNAEPAATEEPQSPTRDNAAGSPTSGAIETKPPAAAPAAPGRQSLVLPGTNTGTFPAPPAGVVLPSEPARAATSAPRSAEASAPAENLVTGAVRPPNAASAPAANGADKTPPALSAGLRAAAAKGDPAAEFEIAQRYADGRGVPQNLAEAAEWFERAAKQGLIPAQFRLGALYEKGLGVKKNLETARRLYVAAAEAGNAKAMHNLAVLYAEGLEGKPDYQTATRWFRKASDRGVIDSQYNLAVLYARGIGVETNLAEAYKWFVLAAREGDKDAGKKRDDVGSRLDQQTLMAARAAAQVWVAEPQPEAAVQVKAPPGGWDAFAPPPVANRRVGPKGAPAPASSAQ
jgi:localization factor PodJL